MYIAPSYSRFSLHPAVRSAHIFVSFAFALYPMVANRRQRPSFVKKVSLLVITRLDLIVPTVQGAKHTPLNKFIIIIIAVTIFYCPFAWKISFSYVGWV